MLAAFLLACLSLLFAPGELGDNAGPESAAPATQVERESTSADARLAPKGEPEREAVRGFRDPRKLVDHFERHGADFAARDAAEYDRLSCALRDAPLSKDVLELERADGVVCRFRRSDGAFLAAKPDGTVLTFFKPERGESYFRGQLERDSR